MTVILSSHPISKDYLERSRDYLGNDIETVSLSEIKRVSLFGIFKIFRKKKAEHLVIVLEDPYMSLTLPAMEILAFFSRCKKISILDHNLKVKKISRLKILGQLFRYPFYTLAGVIDVLFFTFMVYLLKILKRNDNLKHETKELFYIKSNLWFGIKAGGSVGHVAGVINSFIKRGWKTYLFSITPPQMTRNDLNFIEVPFPRPYIYPPDINDISYHRILLKKVRRFGKCLRFKGIIYQRMSVFNFSGVIISRALKCPLILEYNGSEVWISKNWGKPLAWTHLAVKAEQACLRHAHQIVTVSEVLKEELISKGVEPNRIVVYPNCIDPNLYDDTNFSNDDITHIRSKYDLKPEDYVATFVGTFGLWHGVDVLAKAIKKMVDDDSCYLIENKIKFLLVGDGFMMTEVKNLIGGDQYEPFVRFAGLIPQDEGPAILSASDLLLSPHKRNEDGSRFFGSPTKLFEYMGVRKPIIASDLEQIADVLSPAIEFRDDQFSAPTDDSVGILIQPGNVSELIAGIRWATSQGSDLQFLGENARKKALNKFTWNHHVKEIEDTITKYYKSSKPKIHDEIQLRKTYQSKYILIGSLPPPLGGVSVYVQRYSKRLRKKFNLLNIDFKKLGHLKSALFLLRMNFNSTRKIIHLNSGNLAALGILFFRAYPCYVRVQDHSERKIEGYNLLQRFLLNIFLKRVDELILVGEHLKDYYASYGIRLPEKVRIKLTFLPPDPKDEKAIWDSYPEDLKSFIETRSPVVVVNAFKIIYYNGIDLYGLDMSLELIARLKNDFPNIGLLIALADPSDKEYVDQLLAEIKDKNLKKNVYFMMNQRILWPIFKKTDIMIRPTSSDGFGVSVAEALYFGCAAVASDVCIRPKGTTLFQSRNNDDFEKKVRESLKKQDHITLTHRKHLSATF